jgi:general L-amino acid transport system permease protein
MTSTSFNRKEMIPEREPPMSESGAVKWIRANLFGSVTDSIMTLISLYLLYMLLHEVIPWVFFSTWNASSLQECREIAEGGCWAVINERWQQLLYGFYPPYPVTPDVNSGEGTGLLPAYFRPNLTFVLLMVALAPVLFPGVSRKVMWFTGIYPFLAFWLLWGGSIWLPVAIILGFAIGAAAIVILPPVIGTLGATITAFIAPILWWILLTGPFIGVFDAILPIAIPAVESARFGGFMLSVTIGITGIALSLPIGIVLALGRQSNLLIVKSLCVGFIEFIRGVPLITLLFVASVLLNYFLPPGTTFDIILRVMIMVTLFSSAYMAEVIRGGLAALPKGQYEASDALGLDYWKSMRLIIMPQALKITIPSIVSLFIGLFKDTTLVSIIGLLDPIGLSNSIRADQAWNGIVWELYGFIALMFWIFCFSMSRYSMYLERKLATGHR